MALSIRRPFAQRLTDVPVGVELPSVDAIKDELLSYTDVLLGRTDPPVDHGVMTRHEVALAYYARACELEMRIYDQESKGNIVRGDPYYKLRTGFLRTFIEMSGKVLQAGSRQLTHEQLLYKMQTDAGA